MPFNGNGEFNLIFNWPDDASLGIDILPDRMQGQEQDMADGLSNCITRDGQSPAIAPLPMGGFNHINVASSTARTQYARTDQIQDNSFNYSTLTGGTADIITLTVSPAIPAYTEGQSFTFKSTGANTTSVTVAVNALPVKAITKKGNIALAPGDIPANAIVQITYDGTQFSTKNTGSTGTIDMLTSGSNLIEGTFYGTLKNVDGTYTIAVANGKFSGRAY